MKQRRRQSGVTIMEMSIVMLFTMLIFGTYASSVVDGVEFTASNVGGASLHEIGRRTLENIARDLSRTGRFTDPEFGIFMPHVFRNGSPEAILNSNWGHDQQALQALVATFPPGPPPPPEPANPPPFVAPGFELTPMAIREIIFRLPEDLNGDGRILDANQNVEWSTTVYGYILHPNAAGTLTLYRRSIDAAHHLVEEPICGDVEALTFDSVETKGILPMDAIEIHLHLLRRDVRGRDQRLHITTTMVMRNS
jgi:hypothetical protein